MDSHTTRHFLKRPILIYTAVALVCGMIIGGVFSNYYVISSWNITSRASIEQPEGIDMSAVWKAWHTIDEKFVPAAVASTTPIASTTAESNQKRVYGMIEGLAASLDDPYTFFLPPVENQQFGEDLSGAFEGVGMEIAVRNQILTVVSPLKDTPAYRAGLKSGDLILKINNADTKGLDITAAIKKIRGPKGTEVTFSILREGWNAPREIKVTRDVINVPIVITKEEGSDIFVIQVATFTANAPELFRNALKEFIDSGKTKLILDLRGNPGGYLEAAVDMGSWFLPTGKIIVTEDYDGHRESIVHRSLGYDVFNKNLKMVILVDHGSASASEILSDALRFHGIAKLVGVNTFGKGSVQELVPITNDTSLKVTVARWLGPDNKQIPITGIIPDVEVKVGDEDIKAGKDPQMDKAVELLREE